MTQPAPKWFEKAISNNPEIRSTTIKGTKIVYNAWGDKSKPGLIFIHGGMAHAEWWSFIAPYFAKTHRVIAMNLGGMGDIVWNQRY